MSPSCNLHSFASLKGVHVLEYWFALMTCHQTVLSNLQAHANLFELHAAAHEIPTPGILAQSGSAVLCHDGRYRVCDGNMAKSLEYELLLENLIYIMYVYIYIHYVYI